MKEENDKKIIKNYTKADLIKLNKLSFWTDEYSMEDIENFTFLKKNCLIIIYPRNPDNELKYLNYIKNIVNVLKNHNRIYNIKIKINNRELLKQANILGTKNINFTISSDHYDYKEKKYLKEEEQLDKLVEPIKNANLSPYEKYIAVYNIVKNFKPYKENNHFPEHSRQLRYILNNNYMVCVGYSTLLKTLLDKVNIPSMCISVKSSNHYKNAYMIDHQRNIIKIDDDKYNIHGIYIGDATWDNDLEFDLYLNASLTFDKKKETDRLEYLSDYDLLLDYHNFEEFKTKLNYLIKRKTNKSDKDNIANIIEAYNIIYRQIMTILSELDLNKYDELYNKYDEQIKLNRRKYKELEKIYSNFLTEYAMYILPLSNNNIELDNVLLAAIAVKDKFNNYSKEKLKKIIYELTYCNCALEEEFFPYQYDPNKKDNYLDTKKR